MTPRLDIQDFLAELRDRLSGDPAVRDRVLAEAEDHLRAAVEQLKASGVPETEAEQQATGKFGTPSEIALSHSAEQERREDEKVPLPTRWRMIAATGALVTLGFVAYAVLWERNGVDGTQNEAARVQKAFTATRHFRIFDRNGVERGAATVVEVFRSDGSKAKASRGQIAGPSRQPEQVQIRTIDDQAADVYAVVLPEHRLISSHRIPQEDEAGGSMWSETAPARCLILLSAFEADPETEHNNILGYEVLKHKYGGWSDASYEVWVAPELDCYELRSTIWRVDGETGVRYVGAVNDVVTVTEGEPDGENFALPERYRETQPSELGKIAKKMVGSSGWNFSQEVLVLPDVQYHSLRGATP